MTSYLVDINVWLALTWRLHPFSSTAWAWIETLPQETGKSRLLFCRITHLGLLRLLTNEAVMGGSVLTIAGAELAYDTWLDDPRVSFAAEPRTLDSSFRSITAAFARKSATKTIMDAYLAGFAKEERATLITLDKGLQRIAEHHKSPCRLLS